MGDFCYLVILLSSICYNWVVSNEKWSTRNG